MDSFIPWIFISTLTSIINIKHAHAHFMSPKNNCNVHKISMGKQYVGESTHICCDRVYLLSEKLIFKKGRDAKRDTACKLCKRFSEVYPLPCYFTTLHLGVFRCSVFKLLSLFHFAYLRKNNLPEDRRFR